MGIEVKDAFKPATGAMIVNIRIATKIWLNERYFILVLPFL
jgi:hypothetical protein